MNKNILSIETTSDICSVALFSNKMLLSVKEDPNRNHSSLLGVFVEEIFKNSELSFNSLDAIALSIGPGSYTGLRIGCSFAKGLAFSLSKPIIPINTLESLNLSIKDSNYFVVSSAYKDYFFIQEYKNEEKYNDIIFDTIDTIKGKNNIYGYDSNKIDNQIIKISPSALKIAEIAYKNYNNYICHNIKSIKPNYIKPIQFKKNIS